MIRSIRSHFPPRCFLRIFWHHAKAFVAALLYGFPARSLTVIGITGTDGKTTTVGMTAHILRKAGMKVGAMSTAFFSVGENVTWNATQKTSPSPFIVQRFLRKLVKEGCTHAVLECSSHGLVQGRVSWTWPQVAAITNTSFEHLDYHGSMEQYRRDKGILFAMLGGEGTKVLHREDATFPMLRHFLSKRTIVFATHAPDFFFDQEPIPEYVTLLWTNDVKEEASSVSATVHLNSEGIDHMKRLELSLAGSFNIENALCSIACAHSIGVSVNDAIDALRDFQGIPGRMERIVGPDPFSVYVDFTVTPVSYEATLKSLRSLLSPHGRLLVLTGSCGDRMREKRPQIGKICAHYSDVIVVTNEDPYTEDPERIIDEVLSGIDAKHANVHRISDRKEAMKFILSLAKPGDIVALCGKGSDTTMMVGHGQIPWNEREIALDLLRDIPR